MQIETDVQMDLLAKYFYTTRTEGRGNKCN